MPDHFARTESILETICAWAAAHDAIRAVALVGSRARGAARSDSDIDLVLLAVDPEVFRADLSWLEAIDWKSTGVRPSAWRDVRYGDLWSRHVRLDDGLEVEFGFAALSWARRAPLDTGTRRVVCDGCRVLYDPDALLAGLGAYVSDAAAGVMRADDVLIEVDLESTRMACERIRIILIRLRGEHDLTQFEYTRRIRIVPYEIPHSHPVLTLNTRTENEGAVLCTYLHEQMHWYLWRLGSPDYDPISPFYNELKMRYRDAPTTIPEGANDEYSTFLHLVVNWLEIEAASTFLGRDQAIAFALATPVYRWIYRQVVADWDALGQLYRQHGLVPIKPASAFRHEIDSELVAGSSPKAAP